jgi:hypothetical protein
MFLRRRGKSRVGAVAILAVLAIVLAAPAGAAPWGGFGEARELMSGFLPRIVVWLSVGPAPNGVSKICDDGSQIDPNGCPKAVGALPASGRGDMRADDGSRVAPGHRR